jgi:hypothetical protein
METKMLIGEFIKGVLLDGSEFIYTPVDAADMLLHFMHEMGLLGWGIKISKPRKWEL